MRAIIADSVPFFRLLLPLKRLGSKALAKLSLQHLLKVFSLSAFCELRLSTLFLHQEFMLALSCRLYVGDALQLLSLGDSGLLP